MHYTFSVVNQCPKTEIYSYRRFRTIFIPAIFAVEDLICAEGISQAEMLAFQFGAAREREKLAKRVSHRFRKGRDILQTRIAEFRKKSGVTQEELADAVSVTRQTIISLESGKYKASLVLAHKLAQFFNVTIEEMFVFDKEDENI